MGGRLQGGALQLAGGDDGVRREQAGLEEVDAPVELDRRGPEIFPAEVQQPEVLDGKTSLRGGVFDGEDAGERQVLRPQEHGGQRAGPVLDVQDVGGGIQPPRQLDDQLREQHGRARVGVERRRLGHLPESVLVLEEEHLQAVLRLGFEHRHRLAAVSQRHVDLHAGRLELERRRVGYRRQQRTDHADLVSGALQRHRQRGDRPGPAQGVGGNQRRQVAGGDEDFHGRDCMESPPGRNGPRTQIRTAGGG